MTVHFILFSNNDFADDFESIRKELPQVASHHAHSAHSAIKNFFDWHHLKATSKTVSEEELSTTVSPTQATATAELQSPEKAPFSNATDSKVAINGTGDLTAEMGMKKTGTGNRTEEYVAICLAVKDQSRDLGEWLTHHYHHVGIRRFYIMDDGSEPPLSEIEIDHGIPESAISFHYQDRETHAGAMQPIFYHQCNEWYGPNHTWIAYIDADEFFEVTSKNETLEDILRSFDQDEMVGALGVNCELHSLSNTCNSWDATRHLAQHYCFLFCPQSPNKYKKQLLTPICL